MKIAKFLLAGVGLLAVMGAAFASHAKFTSVFYKPDPNNENQCLLPTRILWTTNPLDANIPLVSTVTSLTTTPVHTTCLTTIYQAN